MSFSREVAKESLQALFTSFLSEAGQRLAERLLPKKDSEDTEEKDTD